ncbi:MAG: hypothetical protein DDT31_00418 [Syntrophomonadaceae bacterium]|nr:hypothetical protein [Bacillota bacterium]
MKTAILFGIDSCGKIEVTNGKLNKIFAYKGTKISGNSFQLSSGSRLEISFTDYTLKNGAFPTIITVTTENNPFSFNLRDVNSDNPIFIPEFKVAIVPAEDSRSYQEVSNAITSRRLVSDFNRFESEPEESYENAGKLNRNQYCRTWLGLGRDMRMFRVGYQDNFDYWGQVQPCFHSIPQNFPEAENSFYQINFEIGHGASCRPQITRHLEENMLPILHSTQIEQDVHYKITVFATLENESLTDSNVRGSEWEACYANTGINMMSKEGREKIKTLLDREMRLREQEVVCCLRIEAVNTGKVPRYTWFKAAHATPFKGSSYSLPDKHHFKDGFSIFETIGKIYAVNRIGEDLMPEEEMAILIPPGKSVKFDLLIPHSPISKERADALRKLDFETHLGACRRFWKNKLKSAASIFVPEKPINENIKAGLLQCDLVTLGLESKGPTLATIGWYSPIGTESSPIIQFFDSMGWHKLAERSIQFFFERQHKSGFIQNFNGYESETGPLLWTVGEHFRYTNDVEWLKRVLPNIKKAVDYLLAWRQRNKKDEYREKGFYGMVDGKVADPEDYYHSFFLNAGTYIGLKRIAEIIENIDPEYAAKLKKECIDYRQDIRNGFYYNQATAPVIPLADGSWVPVIPPWVEYTGGINLYADGGTWFTHGAFSSRSCLVGALWLIIGEVIEPDEIGTDFMIKANQYPATLENAALSQPYYCRHDFAHIKRGEVKAFLKTYYNQLTALQDRETYTFWEHYYHCSEHKTHEQGWFLMQTRWMLYLEDGNDLLLLGAVPRKWLENGRKITLDGVKSYFGPLYLEVRSELEKGKIKVFFRCGSDKLPDNVRIRLPHPDNRRAFKCSGGTYSPETEMLTLKVIDSKAAAVLSF